MNNTPDRPQGLKLPNRSGYEVLLTGRCQERKKEFPGFRLMKCEIQKNLGVPIVVAKKLSTPTS